MRPAKVTVRVGATDADLDPFYAIRVETGTRQQFGIHSRDYYAAAAKGYYPGSLSEQLAPG